MTDNKKFQWSRAIDRDIYVVRADTIKELEEGIDEIEKRIKVEDFGKEVDGTISETTPKTGETPSKPAGGPDVCPLDGATMGWLTAKSGKDFWAHILGPGKWCFGKKQTYGI